MSDEFAPYAGDFKQLVFDELRSIAKDGWFNFRARDCRTLAKLCPPEPEDRSPEAPIQRTLLDLIDPIPTRPDGSALDRKPLIERDLDDDGLFGRILYGEPGMLTLPIGENGVDLTFVPRDMLIGGRHEVLAKLRGRSLSTVTKGPKSREPKGGLAYQFHLDLRDRLLLAVSTSPVEAEETLEPDSPASGSPTVPKSSERDFPPHWTKLTMAAAIAFVLILAVFIVVSAISGGTSGSTSGLDRRAFKPKSVSEVAGFGAGLEVNNLSFRPGWTTRAAVDATDRVKFAVWLANRSEIATRPLSLWAQVKSGSEANGFARRVRAVISDKSTGQVYVMTPWAEFENDSGQMGDLMVGQYADAHAAQIFDKSGELIRDVKDHTGVAQLPFIDGQFPDPNAITNAFTGPVDVGKLSARQEVSVVISGSWQIEPRVGFGNVPPAFKIVSEPGGKWVRGVGAAKAGQRIRFSLILDNASTVSSLARVRVKLRSGADGRYVRVQLFGTLEERSRHIGDAIVNSSDNQPIELQPLSGTTYVDRLKDPSECASTSTPGARVRRKILDGIAFGGVDIGQFGGYTPHSKCAGIEFNQWVYFDADVVAKR